MFSLLLQLFVVSTFLYSRCESGVCRLRRLLVVRLLGFVFVSLWLLCGGCSFYLFALFLCISLFGLVAWLFVIYACIPAIVLGIVLRIICSVTFLRAGCCVLFVYRFACVLSLFGCV